MKKVRLVSLLIFFILIPATLILGSRLTGRVYYLISTLVILEIMIPFFLSLEMKKPDALSLCILAVMAALAAISRAAFIFVPGFKPITGIIMITGIAYGAETGFLTGALGLFASNFLFGQGPWTPWQMFAYGFAGFMAGLVFHKRRHWCRPPVLAIFGFLGILCVVGPLLDTCTVFSVLTTFTPKSILVIYAQGVPINILHALGCAVTLLLIGRPLIEKLDRLQHKYGLRF
ncbi:MAG: ECF transporter S component [Lachnospiraceae bacterium]|nr:ECF transporter S component [Lachnospiraceae bacterium]